MTVGEKFRYITPALVTVAIALLGWIKADTVDLQGHFTNHLEHHQDLEVGYERRLSTLETNVHHIIKGGE